MDEAISFSFQLTVSCLIPDQKSSWPGVWLHRGAVGLDQGPEAMPQGGPRLLGSFLLSASLASCLPLANPGFCDGTGPVCRMHLRRPTCGRRVVATPPSEGPRPLAGSSQPVSEQRTLCPHSLQTLRVTSITFF